MSCLGRWPRLTTAEGELFSPQSQTPTRHESFGSHRPPHPGESLVGYPIAPRHRAPGGAVPPTMNEQQYITEVENRVEHLEKLPRWHGLEVANQLIQVPYQISNGETTFLYAVADEYGGGTRLDPVDVLKASPNEIPDCAFEDEILRAAKLRLRDDLELAAEGDL